MLGSMHSMTGYTFVLGMVSGLWALYLVVKCTAHTVQMLSPWICRRLHQSPAVKWSLSWHSSGNAVLLYFLTFTVSTLLS